MHTVAPYALLLVEDVSGLLQDPLSSQDPVTGMLNKPHLSNTSDG